MADRKMIPTCSTLDCGGKCLLKAEIENGVITKITSRNAEDFQRENPLIKACVRSRSYLDMQYHPDRLRFPLKRVGKRGEGRFERISWQEATDIIAKETLRITKQYGAASRFVHQSTAVTTGILSGGQMAERLFALTGGYLDFYHSVSCGNTSVATAYTFGTAQSGSSFATLLDTKLLILWGHNPCETVFGDMLYYLQELKKQGTKIIVVDPRASDTVTAFADEWLPILPTTDNALMDAMSYVIIEEGLHDHKFIDQFCIGFDENQMPEGVPVHESLVAYLFGQKDGIKKTPEWAESICKLPAKRIRQFAREYANAKPAALVQGWGAQRHYTGEQIARGSTVLAALTGNIGVSGGWAGGSGRTTRPTPVGMKKLENPVKAKISIMNWVQAVDDISQVTAENGLKGADQLEQPIKLIYNIAGNTLVSQHPDVNKTISVLQDESKVELIVVSDIFMSPSAKFADIVLPTTTFFEHDNLATTWGSGEYFLLSQKLVEPLAEARTDYDWLAEVAGKMGVGQAFTEKRSYTDWLQSLYQKTKEKYEQVPSYEKLSETAVHYFNAEKQVAFSKQIEDLANHPFPTPSGKIEIFSKRLYDLHHAEIPAIPKHLLSWEGPEDQLVTKYPLQLITWKGKNRVNSMFYNLETSQQIQLQQLWLNPADAKVRGITSGDRVLIANDRGKVLIEALVTEKIIAGVVALQAGAWYLPDENGIDHGGCANVLNAQKITPLAKGNAHKTMLVEVQKIE